MIGSKQLSLVSKIARMQDATHALGKTSIELEKFSEWIGVVKCHQRLYEDGMIEAANTIIKLLPSESHLNMFYETNFGYLEVNEDKIEE